MGKFYNYASCLAILLILPLASNAQKILADDTIRFKKYLAAVDVHYAKDDLDSAEYYCLKARDLAKQIHYDKGIADFISYYVFVLNRQGRFKEGLKVALESVEVCEKLENNHMLAVAYNNVGNQYQYLGDLKSAATHYLNALVFSENTNSPLKQRYTNNLASVFLQLGEKNKSLHYATKSYALALQNQDSTGIASSLVNLALSEVMNEKYDDAIRHLDEVYVYGKALKDDSYVLDSYINRGDIASTKNNYAKALWFYHKSLDVLKKYPAEDYALYAYLGLATTYFKQGKYADATRHLKNSMDVAEALDAKQELLKIYLLGSEINEKKQEYGIALDYRKRYEQLNDSLINAETQQNIHKLETEYRTAQKEKAIAEQELIIANNKLLIQKKNRVILLSATIAVALLSGIVIVLLIYRSKQRRHVENMKLLEKQNELKVLTATMEAQEKERSRLAQDLHDGVNGTLSAAKMKLSVLSLGLNPSETPRTVDEVITIIDQATGEIRTIAHNLSPNIILMNELDTAIVNFCELVESPQLDIEHYVLGNVPKLKNDFKLTVYRAVQEVINNVIKHAKATHVLLQLSCTDDTLSITIEDNGIGFNSAAFDGIGLANLRSRVEEIHGEMQINSSPGNGTAIYMEFDISQYYEKAVIASIVES